MKSIGMSRWVMIACLTLALTSPAGAADDKKTSERREAIFAFLQLKAAQLPTASLDQIKETLEELDDLQRSAEMDFSHQERVLQIINQAFAEVTSKYSERKDELLTPPNVFAGGCEFAVTDFDENIKVERDYMEPKSGYQFLALYVEVANKSREPFKLWRSNFTVKNGAGQVFTPSSSRVEPIFPGSMDIDPGDRLSGWITFEIPVESYKEAMRIKYDSGKNSSRWCPVWE